MVSGIDVLELVRADFSVAEEHTCENAVIILLCKRLVETYLINLLLVVGWMGETLCYLSVIGKHKHSGGVLVQTAHREHPVTAALQEIHHGLVRVRIAGSGDIALRLVHHQIHLFFSLEFLSVELNLILVDVNLGSKFGHHLSIDGNNPGLDESVSLTS